MEKPKTQFVSTRTTDKLVASNKKLHYGNRTSCVLSHANVNPHFNWNYDIVNYDIVKVWP